MTPLERAKAILYELIPAMTKGDLFMPPHIRNPLIARIAAEIHAAVAEAQRWIPVAERLPPGGDEVLIYTADEGFIYLGYFDPHNKSWCADGVIDETLRSATHWQPLPAPPEGM